MFKHILLPTDGSSLSESAVQQVVLFAKSINAKVTGFHVIPEYHIVTYHSEMLTDTEAEFAAVGAANAARSLALVEHAAREAGIPCETDSATSDHPYEEIIKAANSKGCDLIAMASHGRRGLQGLLIGSETQKVLTHSKIPVLVFR